MKNHTWTKNARNFMKWINPLKRCFSLFGPFGLRTFFHQSLRWWWWGWGVKNHTWTKNAGNFMKWINPLKKFFFSLFGPFGLRTFSHQSLRWWWWWGGGVWYQNPPPPTTTHKLNSTRLDLEKWLFMPEICDDILLLPVGNYSFIYWLPRADAFFSTVLRADASSRSIVVIDLP